MPFLFTVAFLMPQPFSSAATPDEADTGNPTIATSVSDGGRFSFVIQVPTQAVANSSLATNRISMRNGVISHALISRLVTDAADIVCRGAYDYPHPSTTDAKKTINAHLSASCSGPSTLVRSIKLTARSQMLDDKNRRGAVRTIAKMGTVKAFGTLPCTADSRKYQAIGQITIQYPPGFARPYDHIELVSQVKTFKKVKGICVPPK